MSENLFHPIYLVWTSIIALIIMWSGKAWRDWRITRREQLSHFKKAGDNVFHQNRLGSNIK